MIRCNLSARKGIMWKIACIFALCGQTSGLGGIFLESTYNLPIAGQRTSTLSSLQQIYAPSADCVHAAMLNTNKKLPTDRDTNHLRRGMLVILRGGEGESAPETEVKTSLVERLKHNQSLLPSDHESMVDWTFAVLLKLYVAFGAPFSAYVPFVKDIIQKKPKVVPLTAKDKERNEREALRKEQDEEFEKALMEDKIKEAEARKKREAAEKEEREAREAAQNQQGALSAYTESIAKKKASLPEEPAAGEGVIMLRLRCPDGLQLTRRFAIAQPASVIYDFVDISRHDKAQNTADPEVKMLELAKFEYVLVCTMPKLLLTSREATLAEAGLKSSCALVLQPILKDDS